jgi:hypothetical protein
MTSFIKSLPEPPHDGAEQKVFPVLLPPEALSHEGPLYVDDTSLPYADWRLSVIRWIPDTRNR